MNVNKRTDLIIKLAKNKIEDNIISNSVGEGCSLKLALSNTEKEQWSIISNNEVSTQQPIEGLTLPSTSNKETHLLRNEVDLAKPSTSTNIKSNCTKGNDPELSKSCDSTLGDDKSLSEDVDDSDLDPWYSPEKSVKKISSIYLRDAK